MLDFLGGLADSLIGGISQIGANKANRKFQREMWDKNNEYNSPLNQRKRMEAAGFNPNLFYGQGTSGNAQMPTMPEIQPVHTDIGKTVGSAMDRFYDIKLKKEAIDNASLTNQNLERQGTVLDEQARGLKIENDQKIGHLNKFNELYQTDISAKKEALRQAQLRNEGLIFQNAHLSENQKAKMAEINQRITNQMSSKKAIDLDNMLREITLEVRDAGIPVNSPWYVQLVARWRKNLQVLLSPDSD